MVLDHHNTIELMTHPDDLGPSRKAIRDSIVAHEPYQVMYWLLLPSGGSSGWDQGEGVYDDAGVLRYLEGLIMDVSEQKFQEMACAKKIENCALLSSISAA